MSEIEKLDVTLELPASELLDHDKGLFVRCPLNGNWIPLTDYYSEQQGSLLPLVGNVEYKETKEYWIDSGKVNKKGQPIMEKVIRENPIVWKETVRILPRVIQEAEGGTLNINTGENINMKDKF